MRASSRSPSRINRSVSAGGNRRWLTRSADRGESRRVVAQDPAPVQMQQRGARAIDVPARMIMGQREDRIHRHPRQPCQAHLIEHHRRDDRAALRLVHPLGESLALQPLEEPLIHPFEVRDRVLRLRDSGSGVGVGRRINLRVAGPLQRLSQQ